jgi:hypothetical protein
MFIAMPDGHKSDVKSNLPFSRIRSTAGFITFNASSARFLSTFGLDPVMFTASNSSLRE